MISSLPELRERVGALLDADLYDFTQTKICETHFLVCMRKKSILGRERVHAALEKGFPGLHRRLQAFLPCAALVDYDAPLGGGPLDSQIVGVFSSEHVSAAHQDLILKSLGWSPQGTTVEYLRAHYGEFNDPLDAYAQDMLLHELGHLYFGWGLSQAPAASPLSWWFSFGMGLLYDREVWNEISNRDSPLFEALVSKYTKDYRVRAGVDQRLIDPDTARDEEEGLIRLQTYGHGKALLFLRALRSALGESVFDRKTREFLATAGTLADYSAFKGHWSSAELSRIMDIESQFAV